MNASSHETPGRGISTVQDKEDVNDKPTAYVDIVNRLDSIDSVISSQVFRLVESVFVAIIP